jgi:hypothetical protein
LGRVSRKLFEQHPVETVGVQQMARLGGDRYCGLKRAEIASVARRSR